jgi:hypothetical protein
MASEELQQKYPDNSGLKFGNFEVFEAQTVTLQQFSEHGILPSKDYGEYKTQKCDALIISRVPNCHAVIVGEHKAPGGITESNWENIAFDLLISKCRPTGAPIGYITDGIKTYWINGQAPEVVLVDREDGISMPAIIDYQDSTFMSDLTYILSNFDPVINKVKNKVRTSPDALAKEVWQTVWRLHADRPEDCLATFVELFVFKFLDDLGLLNTDDDGREVSLSYVMTREKEKSLIYYDKTVRPYIKKLFPNGPDGLSIINGTVLQTQNRDHNIIFYEIMKKFMKFGSLKNTEPEFKMRLYESFLQESNTTTAFGQFFTPRKVVSAIHDMAQVENLPHGKDICDPASGIGGFILEQMARDLASQWKLSGDKMIPAHCWHAY